MRLSKLELEGIGALLDPGYRLTLHDGYVSACRDGKTTLYPLSRMREAVVYSEADMVLPGPAEMVEPEPLTTMPEPTDEELFPSESKLLSLSAWRAAVNEMIPGYGEVADGHWAEIVRKRGELDRTSVPVAKLRKLAEGWGPKTPLKYWGDHDHALNDCAFALFDLIDETEVSDE